jgi:nucleoside-diphosphate-sugar epimerase
MKRVCIVGASGKLGQYMVQYALDRGYDVVCFDVLKGVLPHVP